MIYGLGLLSFTSTGESFCKGPEHKLLRETQYPCKKAGRVKSDKLKRGGDASPGWLSPAEGHLGRHRRSVFIILLWNLT